MLELLWFVGIVVCFVGWVIVLIDLFWVIQYENGMGRFVFFLISSFALTFATWLGGVKISIIRDKAVIITYKEYKKDFEFDKKIDTEIEKEYTEAIQNLKYYEQIGLYDSKKGEMVFKING